ncbi:MAG TPA: hypothetical protein VL049_02505, partial [Candidatus Dormibacteraeota bacterium]|nr:hypothetical protein [Candidatus Dormibacteraeota bacterium]
MPNTPATTARLFTRILRATPIALAMFGGCTCAGKPAPQATPTAAARPSTPTPAASTPTPLDAAAVRQTTCESYVALLAGRKQDPTLFEQTAVQALAAQAGDLVTCGAVVSESDAPCEKLLPTEHGPSKNCLQMRAVFHELRTYPQGRSFMLDDIDWAEFQPLREMIPAAFDGLRAALRAGDVAQCEQAGDLRGICRAYIALDPAQCQVGGDLASGKIALMVNKPGDSKADLKFALEDGCRQTIKNRASLAQGLQALAASGSAAERALAKAALGDATACAAYEQAAIDVCVDLLQAGQRTPAPEQTPNGTGGA